MVYRRLLIKLCKNSTFLPTLSAAVVQPAAEQPHEVCATLALLVEEEDFTALTR
jgi:hypothetical protein